MSSPAAVLERLRSRVSRDFFERVEEARTKAAAAGNVPDKEVAWIYPSTFQRVAEQHGGALWKRARRDWKGNDPGSPNVHEFFALLALTQWRMTRGVYEFDADLLEALLETPLDNVPAEALARMPEYSPYFVLNGCIYRGEALHGAWVTVLNEPGDPTALQVAAHYAHNRVWAVNMLIREGQDIPQMVTQAFKDTVEHAKLTGHNVEQQEQDISETIRLVRRVLSMALYLSSKEPDIEGIIKQPEALGKPRRGARYHVPQQDNMLKVGFAYGGAIRMWQQSLGAHSRSDTSGLGMPRAPHIRKAHWHLYWVGKGRTIPRVKWIAPIAVNVRNLDDMPAYVRPVLDDPAEDRNADATWERDNRAALGVLKADE